MGGRGSGEKAHGWVWFSVRIENEMLYPLELPKFSIEARSNCGSGE